MIRRLLLPIAVLASLACTHRGFPHLDECVNPALESMSWHYVEGRVTEVMSARMFRIRTDKGEIINVSIANVGEPFAGNAVDVLRKRILGTRVSLFPNPSRDWKNAITAEVHDRKGRDLANDLLRKGLVTFTEETAYTLSDYSECVNRIAQREAKAAGTGIWHH